MDNMDTTPLGNSNNSNSNSSSSSEMDMDTTNNNQIETPSISMVAMSTPTTSSNVSSTTTPSSSASGSNKRKRLTPDERMFRDRERAEKRQKLEEERIRKEEEKQRKELEKIELARQKEVERLEKEKIKEQERVKKEEERVKKEAERLEKEKIKEQERIKKEEDIAKKLEEKKKKEEERLKKEEEKKRQLEEKERERKKEEEKKAKQASFFTSFFQKSPASNKVKTLTVGLDQQQQPSTSSGGQKRTSESSGESDKENSNDVPSTSSALSSNDRTMITEIIETKDDKADIQIICVKKLEGKKFAPFPFQLKSNMTVAPLLRRNPLSDLQRDYLDKFILDKSDSTLENEKGADEDLEHDNKSLLLDLTQRAKRNEQGKSGRTIVINDNNEDEDKDIKIEDIRPSIEEGTRYRMKLIQFHANRRPAYWGTWKRKPIKVSGISPLEKEKDIDYDVDSDDEWDDEPEDGEEIENSEGEEEVDLIEDGEPVDEENEEGWMVPHGYLSDNEGEGVHEHVDFDDVKSKEAEFYKSMKDERQQLKMKMPVIQTDNLLDYQMIFPISVMTRITVIRRSRRMKKATTSNVLSQNQGFLALDLPSDDDDMDWDENNASTNTTEGGGSSESNSSNSDESSSDENEKYSDSDEFEEEEETNGSTAVEIALD